MKRRLAAAPGALLLAWTFLCCCFPAAEFDLWWHLKTGQLIWSTGSLPRTDWYTFTCAHERWTDLHWGFQLIVAALHALGGINLIILFKAAVTTAAVGIARAASGRGLHPALSALLWALPALAVTGRAFERPEMLTLLALATWMWILSRLHERPRLIWALPLLQLAWTNVHALSVFGLVVGGAALIEAALRRDLPKPPGLSRRTVLIVSGLVLAACFVNPWFAEGAFFPLELFRKMSVDHEFYARNVGEFASPLAYASAVGAPALLNPYLLAQAIIVIGTALSFVWLWRKGAWSLQRLLLFAGFSFLAFQAVKNAAVSALVLGVIAVANIREAAPEKSRFDRLAAGVAALFLLLSIGVVARVGKAVASTGGALRIALAEQVTSPFGFGERPDWFGHEACRFAVREGMPRRAFVSRIGLAGVYEYHGAPEHKVAMDARLEVCTQPAFESYLSRLALMARSDPTWEQGLRDAGGRLPLVLLDSRRGAQIGGLLRMPGWRLVYADAAAAVFLEVPAADALRLPAVSDAPLRAPAGE